MKKKRGNVVLLEDNEMKDICRVGQGEGCCAFVTVGADGFQCERFTNVGIMILKRLDAGTMVAKGQGG